MKDHEDEVKRRDWMWSLWQKKKKKPLHEGQTSSMLWKWFGMCIESKIPGQQSMEWCTFAVRHGGKRENKKNLKEKGRKKSYEWLRKDPNKKWCLEDRSYMAEGQLCHSKKRLKMDYTYNRMKPNRWKAYQGPPTTKTDWRTGSLCRTYMITFGPGEGCRVTQWWSLRSAVANLRLRWGWWWRQRGRWRLHKH